MHTLPYLFPCFRVRNNINHLFLQCFYDLITSPGALLGAFGQRIYPWKMNKWWPFFKQTNRPQNFKHQGKRKFFYTKMWISRKYLYTQNENLIHNVSDKKCLTKWTYTAEQTASGHFEQKSGVHFGSHVTLRLLSMRRGNVLNTGRFGMPRIKWRNG